MSNGGGVGDAHLEPPSGLSRYGIALLLLTRACSPWGRWRILLAMEAGGLLYSIAWEEVPSA